MDLEMTGLDPARHVIVEIATLVTDDELTIGADRRFLAAYLPEIENYLHYRSVDVSTVKELAVRWYPKAVESAPKKSSAHRALDDIRESVNELRYYREQVFRAADAAAEHTNS